MRRLDSDGRMRRGRGGIGLLGGFRQSDQRT
jgi:hypothetical protein